MTSPIRPLNLDLWPCALWVVKSQFALHQRSEFQWSVFHIGRAPLCFSHTLTRWKHRANSAALLAPCLPPGPPLALFMKAGPLSGPLSAPLPLWCRLPTSWVYFIRPFLLPFSLCSSSCTPTPPGSSHLPCSPSSFTCTENVGPPFSWMSSSR